MYLFKGKVNLYTTFKVIKHTNLYLESHVLQKEACAIVLLTLIATTSTDPQSNLSQGKDDY